MPSIVHFHYNAANNVNIGDEAHVLAIQEALQKRIQQLEITEIPISFLCQYQLPQAVPGTRHLPMFMQNAARRLRGISYQSLIHQVNQADMVVIGGGGVYMDHLLPFNTQLLQQFKPPMVIFGAGYNQNSGAADFTQQQVESIVALGNGAKLHSVRDMNTLAFLKQHGVPAVLVGDPAIFLQKAEINLPKRRQNTLNVGINIAAHGWKQQERYMAILVDAYAQTLRHLQRQHPISLYYFTHHPNERDVVKLLTEKGVVFEEIVDKKARETKAIYSAMDATISMMLHSTIMAYGEGVPAICIGYDKKNLSFMQLTGQDSRHIHVGEATPNTLIRQAQDLLKDLPNTKRKLAKNLQKQQPNYEQFADSVAALIK